MRFIVIFSDGYVAHVNNADNIIDAINKAIEALEHHDYSNVICVTKY